MHSLVPGFAKALLVELVALEQIAQRQREKVQDEHEQRLVLEGEQDAVPAALLALEGVVLHRAGAGTADVVASGGGAEDALVACVVGTPAQVHVLKVGEEVLVKGADLLQNALAVERRAAAGREDALLFGVAAGPAAVAGLAGKAHPGDVITGIVGLCLLVVCLLGFMEIEPNNARVMLFFGKYKGTITDNGFFWVNPLYSKKKITLRARNLDVPPIKVNDKVGNPVMIGAVMVWKVKDTYRAMFDIDSSSISISSNKSFISMGESSELSQRMQNYENFVQIQSDAAIRKIAGMYAYDYNESKDPVTLRSDDGEVAQKLEEELNSRLAIAGIEVLEARINYLAYASEIAGVMLRRQQAEAIIAARERIVEGAVSMVQLALNKLDKDNIVELDEERKAAMVSNLLVVLCADEAAQPVVNTGTLHH